MFNVKEKNKSTNRQMLKYLKFFDYYLEIFSRRLSGRNLMDPDQNGEYSVFEGILKNKKNSFCFIDGGSNVGNHIIKFKSLCEKYEINQYSIFAVEPFPSTIDILKKNLKNISYELIDKALGKEAGKINFFFENDTGFSGGLHNGSVSAIKHYYLSNSIDIEQTTLDKIVEKYNLDRIDFLKLDIEGLEYDALLGAKKTLSEGLIDYIQLEYNQTWIEGGGTIQKVLSLAHSNSYKLYRIRKNDLLAIPEYNFNLEDFVISNLLLVRNGCDLPLPSNRNVLPF